MSVEFCGLKYKCKPQVGTNLVLAYCSFPKRLKQMLDEHQNFNVCRLFQSRATRAGLGKLKMSATLKT